MGASLASVKRGCQVSKALWHVRPASQLGNGCQRMSISTPVRYTQNENAIIFLFTKLHNRLKLRTFWHRHGNFCGQARELCRSVSFGTLLSSSVLSCLVPLRVDETRTSPSRAQDVRDRSPSDGANVRDRSASPSRPVPPARRVPRRGTGCGMATDDGWDTSHPAPRLALPISAT